MPQESADPSQPDTKPLLKFPLADCTKIEGKFALQCYYLNLKTYFRKNPNSMIKYKLFIFYCIEWLPKSFQSRLAKESHVVSVTCKSRVEMLEDNKGMLLSKVLVQLKIH